MLESWILSWGWDVVWELGNVSRSHTVTLIHRLAGALLDYSSRLES